MHQPDTHCPRCGERLKPEPLFSSMQWVCPCSPNGPQSRPQLKSQKSFLDLVNRYGPGLMVHAYDRANEYLFDCQVIQVDFSQDTITIQLVDLKTGSRGALGTYARFKFEGWTAEFI